MSRSRTIAVSIGGALLLALAVVGGLTAARAGEALPGVTVEDVDVGGLGADDLRERLQPLAEARTAADVAIVHDGERFPVDPVEVGVAVDLDALVQRTLAAGRGDGLPNTVLRSLVGAGDTTVDVEAALDRDAVRARVEEVADEVDTEPTDGAVEVDPAQLAVTTTDPADGLATDVDATTEAVVDALLASGDAEVDLVAEVLPAVVDPSSVDAVAEQARNAIAEPLVLRGNDNAVELGPRDVAQLISSRRAGTDDDARLVLAVQADAADAVLSGIVEPLLTDPVDARWDAPRTPPTRFDDQDDTTWRPLPVDSVSLVEGRDGTRFDPELAAEQLEVLLADGVREADLRLADEPADLTNEQARDYRVDTLLSTFTTYHACCAARVTNIQRLADIVDGTHVLPGEQFSINQLSGVRTCESGFAAAGMILDGEIVDSCGGGVSQFGTTTVNAVFFAGLDPDAYKPHSFYISRYPMAREATLNYPSPDIDVRFTNDTGNPVIVRTSYTSTSITVSFYGGSDLTEVRADLGSPTNFRDFETRRRENLDLPPGSERVLQSGAQGFRAPLTRTVVRSGGQTSDDWGWTYTPQPRVVEFNPNPAPRPSPSPSPSADDD